MNILRPLTVAAFSLVLLGVTGGSALASLNAPSNLSLTSGKYTNDTTPTFTWSAPTNATWYNVELDGKSWTSVGNVTTYTLPQTADGWHTFAVMAYDRYGAASPASSYTFEIDTVGPTVPLFSTTTAKVGMPVTFSVTPYGESVTETCSLLIDGHSVATMAKSGSTFSASYTFTTNGSHAASANCTDGDKNTSVGVSRTVTVSGTSTTPVEPVTPPVSKSAYAGDVVKLACSSKPAVNDACHSVYYIGNDGYRHAFPTEDVYMTWYSNYTNVKTVSTSTMSNFPLGKNVTYRPGSVVIKFTSSAAIYAISRDGVLHQYESPYLIALDYGAAWTTALHEVSDHYRENYTVGNTISSAHDYDPQDAWDSVKTINDDL